MDKIERVRFKSESIIEIADLPSKLISLVQMTHTESVRSIVIGTCASGGGNGRCAYLKL